jgi:hypothetical protein
MQAALKRHASTAEPGRHVAKYGGNSNDDLQTSADRLGRGRVFNSPLYIGIY